MRPEFKGNLTQAAIHQLYEKQEARHKNKRRNSRGKEVDHTIKKAPREKPVSIVEQSLYIQEVNGLQRRVFLKSVEKRNIMALDLFASPKEEGMLTSYKPSLSMRPQTKTAQRKTVRKGILLQPCIF